MFPKTLFGRTTRPAARTVVPTEFGNVVLDEGKGRYWHLNDSALTILRRLDEGGSDAEAAHDLVTQFQIDHSTAARDVESTRHHLREVGLL